VRQHVTDLGQHVADAVDDRQRRDAAGVADGHQRARHAIDRDGVGLYLKAIVHVRDVAHEHRASIDPLDRERVDGLDDVRTVVHGDQIVEVADLHIARRQDDVLGLQGVTHIGRCQPARLQRLLIEIGHDDARLAAVGIGHLCTVYHGECRADDVLPEVVERGVRKRAARERQLDDRHVGCAVADHERRSDVGRHVLEHHQRAARELRDRARDVRALVQVDLLDAHALVAGRLDARDVIDQRGHLPLVQCQDAVLNVLGIHAGVGPHDAAHRNIHLRKDVHRHAQRLADPQQSDEDQQRRDGVGVSQDVADECHAES